MGTTEPPNSVVETSRFINSVKSLLTDAERMGLIDVVACNPQAGDVMPGLGGVRKMRYALPGRGKRGGMRVIYFFHDPGLPVFLLAAYAKNERADLSADERSLIQQTVRLILSATSSGSV